MTAPQPFECLLCKNGGRPTLAPRARLRSHICVDCDQGLAPRIWCNVGRHVVDRADWHPHTRKCRACSAAYARAYRASHPGYRERQVEKLRAWRLRNPGYNHHRAPRGPRTADLARNRKRYATDPIFREKKLAYGRMYNARYRKKKVMR